MREQKREGQVMPTIERGPGCGEKKKEDQVVGIIKRGPRCGNKRERARLREQKRERESQVV